MGQFSDKYITQLLADIYTGNVTDRKLPKPLYFGISDYLKKGVYDGFGVSFNDLGEKLQKGATTTFTAKDYELLGELRTNIYMFSAAKTYQQVKDISSLLVKDEKVVSVSEFNKQGRQRFELWNDTYGTAEYNTAVGQAQQAVKWNIIESEKDVLPMLRYSTIGDACDICGPLDGITAPVEDKIWRKITPLNHFNCMCVVLQESTAAPTRAAEKKKIFDSVISKMNPVFLMNSGIDQVVFNEDHPYFTNVPREDRAYAKRNFDLPIPKKDLK